MKKVHEVFPLVIYQETLDCHEEFKKNNLEELKKYWFNGYEFETPEHSSNIFVHLNPNYSDLFKGLRKVFDGYFGALNINYDRLNYHVEKNFFLSLYLLILFHTKEIFFYIIMIFYPFYDLNFYSFFLL
jgi:hypothetical protein